jgi:4a-hydroxytetrahydrobiopterin dehydratase
MTDPATDPDPTIATDPAPTTDGPPANLSRPAASAAVGDLGWRFVLGAFVAQVRTASPAQGVEVARAAVAAAGPDAAQSLGLDLRPGVVGLRLHSRASVGVTAELARAAGRVTAAVRGLGLDTLPSVDPPARGVQLLEIAVDTQDPAAIRGFWAAALGYVDEGAEDGPWDGLVDPLGQGPSVWFQELDVPRPQRNRIHVDVSVAHDEALARVDAAIAAGGVLRSDAAAPAFWVLADADGNEVCICTWQGRDG